MVYPITAHCMEHQHDEDGGFVIEATTIQDPIAFATTLCDESGPLWGPRLNEAVRGFRHWVGLLAMVNDDNNAAVVVDANGSERFEIDFQPNELERIDNAFALQPRGARGGGRDADRLERRSPRPTSRAPAGWATIRRGRSSTGTASRTT